MNSLERARRFLAQKASRLALAVLPLAAVAICSVPAKAGIISAAVLDTGSCDILGGNGTCSAPVGDMSGGNTSMNIAHVSTVGTIQSVSFSGSQDWGLSAGGSGSGTLAAGSVPVSWDFNLINAPDPTVTWEITFTLLGADLSFSQSGSTSTSASPGTPVIGSGSIIIPTTASITGWEITLQMSSSDSFRVDIPGAGTLDLNPMTSAPEPSTLLLMIPGIGALLLLRRKRRV